MAEKCRLRMSVLFANTSGKIRPGKIPLVMVAHGAAVATGDGSTTYLKNLERCADFLSACPQPKKVEFRSASKARKRARRLGMNFYKCVCGSWHLTSRVPIDDFVDWRDLQ
jgi:hypothetical protein